MRNTCSSRHERACKYDQVRPVDTNIIDPSENRLDIRILLIYLFNRIDPKWNLAQSSSNILLWTTPLLEHTP